MAQHKQETDLEISKVELEECKRVLDALAKSPENCLVNASLETQVLESALLLGRRVKSARKKAARGRDRELLEGTGIRHKRGSKTDGRYKLADETANRNIENVSLGVSRRCYICKNRYTQLHPFYDMMCPKCGDENQLKRTQSADLSGRVSVVTGGRVKIGFQIALKLLRAGATVMATSRFPRDAARRYAEEHDFDQWNDRLKIFGCDFRSLDSVNELCQGIRRHGDYLDILINNASQTIRRPAAYYRHLLEGETNDALLSEKASRLLAEGKGTEKVISPVGTGRIENGLVPMVDRASFSATLSQVPVLLEDKSVDKTAFPPGLFDGDHQQIDKRGDNSWVQENSDVQIPELLEVHAVNSLTPFILIQRLEPLLLKSPAQDRYIVNVSAMEGQLNTRFKTGFHPHTNMAKAGINMVTRTSGERFAERRIYMTSVDTGWVTNEFPHEKTERMKQNGFQPPLDEIDGAARVCDPVFDGVKNQNYIYAKFLKDYRETSW